MENNKWISEKSPIHFATEQSSFIHIDRWIPEYLYLSDSKREIEYIKNIKGAMIAPVSLYYNQPQNQALDSFMLNSKKCYNSDVNRPHICKYINYFLNFYDLDKEYLICLCQMKMLMETYKQLYTFDAFVYDLNRYIYRHQTLRDKVHKLVEDNYVLSLRYSKVPEVLQYDDTHAKILLEISILMMITIPLACHYASQHNILNIDSYLLQIYDQIFSTYDVDIYSKIYETALSCINQNEKNNKILWGLQGIRAKDVITHTETSVYNIILNIMPRYRFDQNIIMFNYSSIRENTKFQITDIQFEFKFIALSSSERDEDNNSEFDKFESYLIRQDEAKYIQNKVNCEETMKQIEDLFGPFDDDEIQFYRDNLRKDGEIYINKFLKKLVYIPFYRYFGDTTSINSINSDDWIKLVLSVKKLLLNYNMVILPYVLSSYPEKIISRKSMNKSDMDEVEKSEEWKNLLLKYRDKKVPDMALSDAATIIASKFKFIDYYNPDICGKDIPILAKIIRSEVFMLYLL